MSIARYGLRLALPRGPGLQANDIICDQIPRSIDAALNHFNLQGKTTTYAVYPECHCTYKPEVVPGSSKLLYPQSCSNRLVPETGGHKAPFTCGAVLIEEGDCSKPIKTFLYYSFHDYLAGLLSRPDLELLIDDYCDDFVESLAHPPPPMATDASEADFLKEFIGPVGGKLFLDRGQEIRTAFTLNVDFFDVEGMSQRGRKTSCGIIAMACLNLPGTIRYKPENMYLAGIVPGPDQPHLTDLNHYLDPLIDDLVESYERGVYYSRTALHPNGRVSRSAIAAAVNDLPGGRKVAAMASHNSHHYCFICNTKGLENLGKHNCHEWPRKDPRDIRKHAEMWRDATTSTDKSRIFKDHGVRWSSLWRLSYWDPTRPLVIDAMHCILEGIVQYHSRYVLLLTDAASADSLKSFPVFSHDFRIPAEEDGLDEKSYNQVFKIHSHLTAPIPGTSSEEIHESLESLATALHRLKAPALEFVAHSLGRAPSTKAGQRVIKMMWVRELIEWVRLSRNRHHHPADMLPEKDKELHGSHHFYWGYPARHGPHPASHQRDHYAISHTLCPSKLWRSQSWNLES
jgi:hypothetical protein